MGDNAQSDANILILDGQISLEFGETTVQVKGLILEASVQWSTRVKTTWLEQAQKQLCSINLKQASEEKDPNVEQLKTGLAEVLDSLKSGEISDLFVVRDLLSEHSPKVLTLDVMNAGTSQQIVAAFEKVYLLENPMKRLRNAMAKA